MSSLPTTKLKQKYKLKKSKHNNNQNRQKSNEKNGLEPKTCQKCSKINCQNEKTASMKCSKSDLLEVL